MEFLPGRSAISADTFYTYMDLAEGAVSHYHAVIAALRLSEFGPRAGQLSLVRGLAVKDFTGSVGAALADGSVRLILVICFKATRTQQSAKLIWGNILKKIGDYMRLHYIESDQLMEKLAIRLAVMTKFTADFLTHEYNCAVRQRLPGMMLAGKDSIETFFTTSPASTRSETKLL